MRKPLLNSQRDKLRFDVLEKKPKGIEIILTKKTVSYFLNRNTRKLQGNLRWYFLDRSQYLRTVFQIWSNLGDEPDDQDQFLGVYQSFGRLRLRVWEETSVLKAHY